MTTARWPLDVLRAGPVAAGVKLWRIRGQLHVTVIAKATFAMIAGGEAQQIEPLEVIQSEVYTRGHPMMPLLAASELAPWLERAEVVLTGHAWAPGGAPVRRMPVRLAILRGAAALVDKRIEVVGDRTATAASPDPEPQPFVKMPIEYQRAWGNLGDPENPFGVGVLEDPHGRTSLPNLLSPGGRRGPIGLGPIPPFVPSRAHRLRSLAYTALEGIATIPDDFDWSYFQSAPADQRFDRVLGGEQIVLEGLSPHHPALATRLPALRALATIYLPNGAQRWVLLTGDMLVVHPDAERCAVVFRGSFQVAQEDALPALRVAVGVEVGGRPVPWPDVTEVLASAPIAAAAAAAERVMSRDWSTTVKLDDEDIVDAPVSAAAAREHPLAGTLPLDGAEPPPGIEVGAASSSTAGRGAPGSGGAAGAPFPLAPAGAHGDRRSGEHPDAPWAAARATAIPAAASPLEGTIDLGVTATAPLEGAVDLGVTAAAPLEGAIDLRSPAAAPAPAPVAAPAPAPAPVAAPAPALLPPTPAPPARKQERPDLVGSLYKRFLKG
ncbi:DUF2169 family type VI secretion system accessory protein [Sorangium sp. So ce233]|uniref:DUF2169 family type VI secretion system accessory protein n=1 Tax=Sorangium sp. So ce233 TaxID=3133290 RepID=UPI003F624662